MKVEELHFEFKRRWDKQANNHRKGFTDVEIDQTLNSAVNEYMYIFGTGRNPKNYDVGFEVNQQMIDMLQTLVVSYPETGTINSIDVDSNIDYANLPNDYRYLVSAFAVDHICGDEGITIEKHGDLSSVLKNFHRKANRKFRNIPGTIRADKLYMYHNGVFDIQSVKLTYIKDPAKICIGTYKEITTAENTNPPTKPKQECYLTVDYHDILVDIAVQETSRIYLNTNRYQLGKDKLNDIT